MNAQISQELVTAASAVAAIAINALWQDALLVLGVWGLLRAWPHLNASTRYTVWSATLVAAVLVPIATTVPFLAAPPPPVSSNTGAIRESRTPILTPETVAARHAEPSVAHGAGGGVASETLPRVSSLRFPERFRLTLPLPVAIAIAGAWALLALLSLFRLAVGIVKLEALKRDALPLPVEYRDAMERWTAANKGSRDVRLCVSDDTDVPVAVGLFDSMILIPRVLLDQLSETEVDQISLHELAHLRRADDWTNGLQRVFLALLAWNPAARFIGQQLDLEREVACDDWVLGLTGAVRPYALCLTKMAETSSWPRSPIPAPGVFATRKHISLRIERLLGAGRNIATNLSIGPAAAAVAIVGALAFAIAIVAPSIAAPIAVVPATPVTHAVLTMDSIRIAQVVAASPVPSVVHIPAIHVHQPARTIVVPATNVEIPARDVPMPPIPPISTAQALDSAKKAAAAGARAGIESAKIGTTIAQTVANSLRNLPSTVAQSVTSCMGCAFRGVDWSGRDMHGVNYTGADFSSAKLRGTNFSGGTFNGVDFTHADLHGASFRNATLTGADFKGADLSNVDFTGAKLNGGDFSGTDLSTSAARSILASCVGCDFSHASLAGMDLANITINGDDLSHANLRNVNLSNSTLTGVDLSGAQLDGAVLNGTTFNGTDFGGVDLTHVDLSKAHLIGVDLSNKQKIH